MTDTDTTRRIVSIIRVFETGRADGDYGAATILPDGAGISFGALQSTDKADSLDRIVMAYIDAGGALANELREYLPRLTDDATARVDPKAPPPWVKSLLAILRATGADPVMRMVQDHIFDESYVRPALLQAEQMHLALPLSHVAVLDTVVQSGPGGVANIRKRFPQSPPVRGGDEMTWARAYLQARSAWLAGFLNPIVQRTVYRPESLLLLADAGNWDLAPPFKVRGVVIA